LGKLEFKKLTLEDKSVFDKYFSKSNIDISEYTFTNLFVWRNYRNVEFAEFNGGLVLLAIYENEKYFLPPIGFDNFKDIVSFLLDFGVVNNMANSIRRVCEPKAEILRDSGLKLVEDPDNFDYVYESYELAHLKGRKYSSKRNFITSFFSDFNFEYKRYDDKYLHDCLNLTEFWISKKDANDKSLYNEYLAIKELLLNYSKLDALGSVLLIDGKVEAFAFGEKLNNDTFVIHFEKANPELKGIYQTINKLFVEKEVVDKYQYVNREQDLGIPGIKKAKESYFPVKMIKKYNITGK
jgi:uncharacterized protein